MASQIQKNFRARKTFAKLKHVIEIPNLIDIQKRSYDKFLQIDVPIDKREDIGLQGVFKSVFPIKDFSETSSLEFVSYNLEKPKYDVDECRARGMTFAAPIKVVREVTGLGLKDAKDLVDGAPKDVKVGVNKAESDDIAKKLKEAGAEVEIK